MSARLARSRRAAPQRFYDERTAVSAATSGDAAVVEQPVDGRKRATRAAADQHAVSAVASPKRAERRVNDRKGASDRDECGATAQCMEGRQRVRARS